MSSGRTPAGPRLGAALPVRDPGAPHAPGDPSAPRGHRRRIRGRVKTLIILLVLAALLVVVDRVAEVVTARRLAERIQSAQHLPTRPDVSIGGWPFLTQALVGHYGTVTISSRAPIGQNGVTVSDANVHLYGVQVSTSQALHGTVADVPVASGEGTALLTYPELDVIIAKFAPAIGSQVTVVGTTPGEARFQGPFGLALDVTAKIARGKLIVTPDASQLAALPEPVRNPIGAALAQPMTLPPFPFNVHLASAVLEPDGIHLRATAHNSVFPIR